MTARYDVAIVGGGVAGAALAGVLARAGFGVVVVEKERRFRDRVRGEGIHPWGVAEVDRLGLTPVLRAAGAVDLPIWQSYADRQPEAPYVWADDSVGGLPEVGVSHPRLQEAMLTWAAEQGATVERPAKAVRCRAGSSIEVDVHVGEAIRQVVTRLLVGADGRASAVRRWIGAGERRDPVHHRFGGGLLRGTALDPRSAHAWVEPGRRMFALPQGDSVVRCYVVASFARFESARPDADGATFVDFCGRGLPEGALDGAELAGPIAFFPNADVWPDRIAGDGIVLIGDAAGANDPSVGNGLSLVFRDVRELSELLLEGRAGTTALGAYAERRTAYFAPLRAHAAWVGALLIDEGEEADATREQVRIARECDPSAGGFALLFARGPDGLVADEAARRRFFGEL